MTTITSNRRPVFLSLAALALAFSIGCGPGRTASEAAGDLRAGESEVRLVAAREIEANARKDRGLPAEVTETLLQQFPKETDRKTKGSLITALGYTGDPRVKPLLEQYVQTEDPEQQRWGSRAYKKYAVATKQVPANHKFVPDTFPFGTPGYPNPAFK